MGTASSKSDTLSPDNNLDTSPPVKSADPVSSKKIFEVVNGIKLRIFPKQDLSIDDKSLRENLNSDYSFFLKKLIAYNSGNDNIIESCSEGLTLPYFFALNKATNSIAILEKKDIEDIEVKSLTSPVLFEEVLKLFFKNKNYNDKVLEGTQVYPRLEKNEDALRAISSEYNNDCKYLQYFIPLHLIGLYSKMGHQNLLIFNKEKSVVTWIEPQYNGETVPYSQLIRRTINVILKDIIFHGQEDAVQKTQAYEIDFPTKNCPQYIVKDTNCMFWTLLLTMTLIENPSARIDDVSEAYLTKYPDKFELEELMNNFKMFLTTFMNKTLSGGKRRKTYRKKLKNKRKKTRKLFTSM